MNYLLRRFHLLRVKVKAFILQAELDHAEALLSDHERRYQVTLIELLKVRRRIALLEQPEVILRNALRRT